MTRYPLYRRPRDPHGRYAWEREKFQYLWPINISRKRMQRIEGGERPRTDKYMENMHDLNCDRRCTLTSLPVWHWVIKIIYRNTRLISIIINSQFPLLSPHIFGKFFPQNFILLYPGTQHLIVLVSQSNHIDLAGRTPSLL